MSFQHSATQPGGRKTFWAAEIVSNVEQLQQLLRVEEIQFSFSQISTLSLLAAPAQLLLKEKRDECREGEN